MPPSTHHDDHNQDILVKLIESSAQTSDAKLTGIAQDVSEIKSHMLTQNGRMLKAEERMQKAEKKLVVHNFIIMGMGGTIGTAGVVAFFKLVPYIVTGLLAAAK